MLTYAEALETLKSAERFGIQPTLEDTIALAEALGRPQDAYASIQVTGTNGKSSTARMIAALLEAHDVRTGTYTSPELESITERIELSGHPVSETDFARAITAACAAQAGASESDLLSGPAATQFELLTIAALWLLRARHVEVACLEVGMGGRWDATSIVSPVVSVITGVGLDHTEHLGTTREAIAEDKSQIIKAGSTAVVGPGTAGVEELVLRRAREVGAPAIAVRDVGEPSPLAEEHTVRFEVLARPSVPFGLTRLSVRGLHGAYGDLELCAPAYQAPNAATAVAAAEVYLGRALDARATRNALSAMTFPGRFELVRSEPAVVIDGAHNPQAAATLASAIVDAWPAPDARPVLLLGILADKDAEGIVAALAPVASAIAVTQSASARALPAADLAALVTRVSGTRPSTYATVADALDELATSSAGGLVVTGSITTAGEARRWARELSELPDTP